MSGSDAEVAANSDNLINSSDLLYVNCGAWQLGSTDFVVISQYSVVLCSLTQAKPKTYLKSDSDSENDIYLFSKENDKELFSFLMGNVGVGVDSKMIHVLSSKTIKVPKSQYKLTDKLIIILPDCHISMFKGWTLDGFCKPALDENGNLTEVENGYPHYSVSYEDDLVSFLKYAKDKTVIQIGDLRDCWHTQWMYERAFDIYCEKVAWDVNRFNIDRKNQHYGTTEMQWEDWIGNSLLGSRYCPELLSHPDTWKEKFWAVDAFNTTVHRGRDWWRHFHKYVGETTEAPLYKNYKQLLKKVASKWNKLCPHDIIAIIWWEMELEWFATPLSKENFNLLNEYILGWQKNQPVNDKGTIALLKKFMNQGGEPLNFLEFTDIEKRINAQYEESGLAKELEKFTEGSNYIRGNHDCTEKNEYLSMKFNVLEPVISESDLKDKLVNKTLLEKYIKGSDPAKQKKGLDDADLGLDNPQITLRLGEKNSICIEHGDAWDRQNNGKGYFRFRVGNPWTDAQPLKGESPKKPSEEEKMTKLANIFDDGGYHAPKGMYNNQQLEDPGSVIHKQLKTAGDVALEPTAELRMQWIFRKSEKQKLGIRVVVMGHTHISKIVEVDMKNLHRIDEEKFKPNI